MANPIVNYGVGYIVFIGLIIAIGLATKSTRDRSKESIKTIKSSSDTDTVISEINNVNERADKVYKYMIYAFIVLSIGYFGYKLSDVYGGYTNLFNAIINILIFIINAIPKKLFDKVLITPLNTGEGGDSSSKSLLIAMGFAMFLGGTGKAIEILGFKNCFNDIGINSPSSILLFDMFFTNTFAYFFDLIAAFIAALSVASPA